MVDRSWSEGNDAYDDEQNSLDDLCDSPEEILEESSGTATVSGDVVNENDRNDADEADSDAAHPRCDASEDDETGDIDAHYERLTPVLEALGESDGTHTLGVHDHHGWYRKTDETNVDLIDEGYDRRARPYDLHRDADEFLRQIDRHYYAVLNYQSPEILRDAEPCRTTEDGTEWRDEKPLPKYSDIEALTLFVDIDLKDEHKERPLSDEKRETFEEVISGFVDAFGTLVGDDAHVFALDSVGGAYVLIRPQVTASVADEFDGEARAKIFDELASCVRSWIDETEDEILRTSGAHDLCKADPLVNVNRQYKAPLSLHKSIDGVVHPLDTEDVSYEFVPFDAVDDALVDETVAWSEEFTAPVDDDEPLGELIGALFDEYDGATWDELLWAYLKEEREKERRRQERAERAAERRADGADFEDAEVTQHFEDVQDAVDRIDVGDVVQKYACDEFDTSSRTHETTFDPSWRGSESGKSCAIPDDSNGFIDNTGGGGGPAKAYALGAGILSGADDALEGDRWWRAVDGLRSEGYGIPVYVPEKGTPKPDGAEYEQTPLWGVRKGAVALGVVDADGFVEKENDEGEVYEVFPDRKTRNETLNALEEEGIEHGCEYSVPPSVDGGSTETPDEPQTHDENDAVDVDNWVSKAGVKHVAGLGEDDGISDLTDREKAACVWELIKKSNEYYVRVRRDNGTLWAYDDGVWVPEGERTLRHAARQAVGSMNYGENVLNELKSQVRSDLHAEVEADEFGVETGMIAVRNGLLDLDAAAEGHRDGALRELRPEDYAPVQLPVSYDARADYDEWHDLVDEWSEEGHTDAIQEYVGYCLEVGAMPIHRALLLVGGGANGKSTFLHVVRELLGEDNITSTELQTLANEKDAVADFYGALANVDDDLSSRKLGKGVGMFKKLIAGDKVRGRRLYEDAFEFEATGKHLYAANEVPDVSNDVDDEDEAFWRRWLLVEFPNHYPRGERDPELRDRWTTDEALSAVLKWAVDGRRRLLEQGYFTGEYGSAFEKRDRWKSWGDSLDEFLNEHVEHDEDADNVSTGYAYNRYKAWCRENSKDAVGQRKFTTKLRDSDMDVGYSRSVRVEDKTGQPNGYKHLGFSDEVPEVQEERDDGQEGIEGFGGETDG
jgi:P4 family phage/plasmid primase-like protien